VGGGRSDEHTEEDRDGNGGRGNQSSG
jgi:hypothetical protein